MHVEMREGSIEYAYWKLFSTTPAPFPTTLPPRAWPAGAARSEASDEKKHVVRRVRTTNDLIVIFVSLIGVFEKLNVKLINLVGGF